MIKIYCMKNLKNNSHLVSTCIEKVVVNTVFKSSVFALFTNVLNWMLLFWVRTNESKLLVLSLLR